MAFQDSGYASGIYHFNFILVDVNGDSDVIAPHVAGEAVSSPMNTVSEVFLDDDVDECITGKMKNLSFYISVSKFWSM